VGSARSDYVGGLNVALSESEIAGLLAPYLLGGQRLTGDSQGPEVDRATLYRQMAAYLELLLKWNARMNLTAIREPVEIVQRHFGESLFAGEFLGDCATLLDYGSGAGFPGIPIRLLHPKVRVTLAESQGKKAAFLREAVRVLGLECEVWDGRVEAMPADRRFDTVAMRAVDGMGEAIPEASRRATNRLIILGTSASVASVQREAGFSGLRTVALPASERGLVLIATR
jgi:16S rRNA (guanine527-N7)-methyltransferase